MVNERKRREGSAEGARGGVARAAGPLAYGRGSEDSLGASESIRAGTSMLARELVLLGVWGLLGADG